MGINAENFIFDRVYRIGSDKAKKPRAILVKFHYYSGIESVRLKSYDANIKRKLRELFNLSNILVYISLKVAHVFGRRKDLLNIQHLHTQFIYRI